jgi:hypothetical protein
MSTIKTPAFPAALAALATLAGAACTLVLAANPAAAAGKVEVSFKEPEKFADIGWSTSDRERALKSLGDYLQALGKDLPDGQTLQLQVLDVDLAGRLEPLRWREIRVMTGRTDWPHMTLRYTLQGAGTTLKSGEAELSDMNYLFGTRAAGQLDGEFVYEKRMLQRWFAQTLLAP